MKFHKMRLKNFMPFIGTDHEISFPTDDHTNILLIHGPNTYGKTSILMAIKWGLYGRVYKRNRQLDFLDILNKTSSKVERIAGLLHHLQVITNSSDVDDPVGVESPKKAIALVEDSDGISSSLGQLKTQLAFDEAE